MLMQRSKAEKLQEKDLTVIIETDSKDEITINHSFEHLTKINK